MLYPIYTNSDILTWIMCGHFCLFPLYPVALVWGRDIWEQQSVDITVLMSRLSSLINPPDMIRIAPPASMGLHNSTLCNVSESELWELLYIYHFLSIENQTKCIFGILVWEWKVNLLILTRVINLINLSFCAAFNQTSSNPFNTFPSNIYAEASTTLQQVAEKKIDKCVITSVAVSAETSQWWITLEYQERKQVSMY